MMDINCGGGITANDNNVDCVEVAHADKKILKNRIIIFMVILYFNFL